MALKSRAELIRYLREHIVGAMHVGQLRAGDRLPSIRELADRFALNARTVKAAYAALEAEGLIEVRGRSGVFLARQEVLGGEAGEEMARWLSDVLAEAWKRRITVGMLPQVVKRFTTARPVRCALVELIEDGIVALRHELEVDWGFAVRIVGPDSIDDARDVDFFAATSFYTSAIRDAVEAFAKPLVVLTTHPALQEAIRSRVREGVLTVVAIDPRFGHRIQVAYSPDHPERIRLVRADDMVALARLDPDEAVLLTRAASQKLGTVRMPLIFPHSPTLSPETARALAAILVRSNLEVAGS